MYVRNNSVVPEDSSLRLTKVGLKDEAGDYTWETKVDVAAKILALGNIRQVADLTKIPYNTLLSWKKRPWWPQVMAEVKSAQRQELDSKLGKIVQKALDAVEDRIENGEYVLNNKTGTVIRKQVSLRDVNKVASDLLGQRIKLEAQDNKDTQQTETFKEVIGQLAEEFAKFNRRQLRGDATDISYKDTSDALHDQRET